MGMMGDRIIAEDILLRQCMRFKLSHTSHKSQDACYC